MIGAPDGVAGAAAGACADAGVIAAVKAAGYTNAVTENPGFATRSTDPFLLPRFEIEGGVAELAARALQVSQHGL